MYELWDIKYFVFLKNSHQGNERDNTQWLFISTQWEKQNTEKWEQKTRTHPPNHFVKILYLLIAKATQEIAFHGQLVTKVTDSLGHTFQFHSALKWLETIF